MKGTGLKRRSSQGVGSDAVATGGRGKDRSTASIHRLHPAGREPQRSRQRACGGGGSRDALCELCVRVVSVALSVPLDALRAPTRSQAEAAFARQIAMYLAHTTFGLLMTEVGIAFGRDRTTVAHACTVVEDRRDDPAFDTLIGELEALLHHAATLPAVGESA